MTNFIYGNRSHLSINDANSVGDTVVLGNGAVDSVLVFQGNGATITLGNGHDDIVNEVAGFNSVRLPNIITLGNGSGDGVYAQGSLADIVTLGNGAGDFVGVYNCSHATVTLGNGPGDVVNIDDENHYPLSGNNTVTLGNGNHDVVNAQNSAGDFIVVGNGNDTIYAGLDTTMTVGTGHDSFVFEPTAPGAIGQATITGFDPHKDSITFSNQLTNSVSYHDDAHGNAVIAVDCTDTITLEGVHAAQLHLADFHFVDDPAAAIAQHLQQIADHHAHIL